MADAVIDLPENDPAIDRAVKIIEENLIKEMPDCHVTSLHENDAGYAPLLQKYEDCYSGLQVQGTANTPAARVLILHGFKRNVNE